MLHPPRIETRHSNGNETSDHTNAQRILFDAARGSSKRKPVNKIIGSDSTPVVAQSTVEIHGGDGVRDPDVPAAAGAVVNGDSLVTAVHPRAYPDR
jgi:hypothetical protein